MYTNRVCGTAIICALFIKVPSFQGVYYITKGYEAAVIYVLLHVTTTILHGIIYMLIFLSPGTLCGECREEGMGVSALLNECVTCTSASGLLILSLSQYIIIYLISELSNWQ